jgi:hypothetical protein
MLVEMVSGPVHLHQRPYQRQEDDHTFLARAVALNCRRMAKYIATWAIGIGIYIPNHRCYSHTDLFSTLKRNISALSPCRAGRGRGRAPSGPSTDMFF